MHFSTLAAALCLSLSIGAAGFAAVMPALRADASGAVASGAVASGAVASGAVASGAVVPGDAAAKHAKRTACLKEAKNRKLVGADKTSFLKNCIAAP
jgi:hypothetical protein